MNVKTYVSYMLWVRGEVRCGATFIVSAEPISTVSDIESMKKVVTDHVSVSSNLAILGLVILNWRTLDDDRRRWWKFWGRK